MKSGASFSCTRIGALCFRRTTLLAVLVAMVLSCAAGTRLYRLGGESLWLDEHTTWNRIDQGGLTEYLAQLRTRDATFVPAYYITLYYWGKITGYHVTAARMLSVGLGVTAAFLVYLLASRPFGAAAGITALVMTALSNTHVYYTQEIRVYALYCAAALVSAWSLERALRTPGRGVWALHLAANVLLVFSHYFGALFLIAEGLYLLLFHRTPWTRLALWCLSQALLAGLLVLWMLGIRRDVLEATTAFLMLPRPETLEYAFSWAALYLPRSLYTYAPLTRGAVLAVILLTLYVFWTRNRNEQTRERWQRTVLYLLLMAVPVLAALAMSWLVRPAFTLRYLLPSSLFFFVLFGGALGSLPSRYLRWGAVAALAALMTLHHVEASRPYRPDMRKAGQILSQQNPGKNGLLLAGIFNPDMERMYLTYAEEHVHRCAMTGEAPAKTLSLLDRYDAVWLLCEFDYGRGYPSHEALEKGLKEADLAFERIELSADHYTFMTNSNWPDLSDIARRIVLYRVCRLPGPDQARNSLPAAISIFNS